MSTHIKVTVSVLVLLVLILGALVTFNNTQKVEGAAFTGTAAYQQFGGLAVVGPEARPANTIATSTPDGSCKARVVTTNGASAIMIAFADTSSTTVTGAIASTTLSATLGHLQAASTTVVYDAGLYGCGRMSAWAWATTSITVSTF